MKLFRFSRFSMQARPMVSKFKTREEWEEFAKELYEKVGEALDYFCWNISGDTALDCYSGHSSSDLYELAEEFAGWSSFGITEEDLELLREMPEDIFEKYSHKMQDTIEKVVQEIIRKYGAPEEEYY